MVPGPDNLGIARHQLAAGNLRIHGTNEPATIGHALSDGCIRMRDDGIVQRVKVGALVIIER